MSGVPLATRYSPENYPIALENLTKRYEKNNEPVHYSDAGFGQVSEDQANAALRFFAEIELIENPKGANYVPPEAVVTWMRKMGPTKEEAKREVQNLLMDYDVFNELMFVLKEGEQHLDSLSEQVGGLVGIDEDELTDMKRTIRVFTELGFLNNDAEDMVSIPDETVVSADEESSSDEPQQESLPTTTTSSSKEIEEASAPGQSLEVKGTGKLSIDLSISLDATEMEVDDLREKLEVIRGTDSHDGE